MDTGLYYGLRLFEWDADKPELSNNDFYCKDYDHREYVCTDPDHARLLAMGFLLPASALGETFSAATVQVVLVCTETGESEVVDTESADWVQTDVDDGVYVHYKALNDVSAATEDIPVGIYHIEVNNVVMGGTTYRFYSDSFVLKHKIST